MRMNMDQRGGNPVKAVITLLAVFAIFFLLFVYFTEPLTTIWDVTEDASPEGTPDVKTGLWNAWLIIMMVVIVFLGVWFFAYLHSRERETEVFLR